MNIMKTKSLEIIIKKSGIVNLATFIIINILRWFKIIKM